MKNGTVSNPALSPLPDEVFEEILKHLDLLKLLQAKQVSKNWYRAISNANPVWKTQIRHFFPYVAEDHPDFKSDPHALFYDHLIESVKDRPEFPLIQPFIPACLPSNLESLID